MTIKIEIAEEDLDFIIETLAFETEFNDDHGDPEGDEDEVDRACRAVVGRRVLGYLQTLFAMAKDREHSLFGDD